MYSLCCISNALARQGFKFQTLTYASFAKLERSQGLERLGNVILNNVKVTYEIIEYCHRMGWAYRISSALFPLITYDKANVKLSDLPAWLQREIDMTMSLIALFVTQNNFHLSCHPDQFCVLSSQRPEVRVKSIQELNFHGWVMDRFGAKRDYGCPINVHLNDYKGNNEEIVKCFLDSYHQLDYSVRSRLVVENEDKPNSWSVKELVDYFYPQVNIPITFDSLHHELNSKGMIASEAFYYALESWHIKQVTPHFHYSESLVGANPRAHAHMPTSAPNKHGYQGDIVWDIELKGKDEAILAIESIN